MYSFFRVKSLYLFSVPYFNEVKKYPNETGYEGMDWIEVT
jgi:hypothetical protein